MRTARPHARRLASREAALKFNGDRAENMANPEMISFTCKFDGNLSASLTGKTRQISSIFERLSWSEGNRKTSPTRCPPDAQAIHHIAEEDTRLSFKIVCG